MKTTQPIKNNNIFIKIELSVANQIVCCILYTQMEPDILRIYMKLILSWTEEGCIKPSLE